MKTVLITSGGTKIKIDRVRSITNMSRGTFGSKIADSLYGQLNPDFYKVIFLYAKGSRLPSKFREMKLVEYETFEDYERMLFKILENDKPDVVLLAAAVSDYGVSNYVDGKIRSDGDLVIHLKPLPKLISKVRDVVPDATICGFKLLVDSTEEELKDACVKSMDKNRLDCIVGNDLRDIQDDNHTILLGRWEGDSVEFQRFSQKDANGEDTGSHLHSLVATFTLLVDLEKRQKVVQ
jgi:phosphopantothenoylcysteine synthetase/decarboxylase